MISMFKLQNSYHSLVIFLFPLIFVTCESALNVKRSLSFSLSNRINQTGHAVTQLFLDKSLPQFPNQWNLKIDHKVTEEDGKHGLHLNTIFTALTVRPSDYELFPGVGYYKFHTTLSNGFEDASSKCAKEGGHLVIVNSESEHQVLQTMFARYPESTLNTVWAFVGFHDRLKEGEYVTIFGEPLNSTGYTRWSSSNQPDNYKGVEDCGSVHRNGGLNDIPCSTKLPFFCEYDLSWS